jgi:pimeloyl-ACP methyl ester carboxylesterase
MEQEPERPAELVVRGDGGVRLATRRYDGPGRDAHALLLHHGLASSSRIWHPMLPRLLRRFRVVTYDARGHGRSGKPTSAYGFDHVAADALAVAAATRLRRPIVVGHSWGAMVALELAARYPRRVGGAVLVDGGLSGPGEAWDWPTTKSRLSPPPLAGMRLDEFRAGIDSWSPLPFTPELETMFLSLMHVGRDGTIRPRLSRANHLRILRAIWEQRPLALYRRLTVPTLVIAAREPGADDRAWIDAKRQGMTAAREASTGRPVTFEWMRGVHDLPLQHPDRLARRIDRFADERVGLP